MRRVVAVIACAVLLAACGGGLPGSGRGGNGPATDDAPLQVGDAVEGQLDAGSRRSHALEIGEGQVVEVALVALSDGLDCYLRIYDADDRLVAEDDDSGDGLDSLATVSSRSGATFRVEAGSFGNDDTGRYRLEATRVAVGGGAVPTGQVLVAQEGEVGGAAEGGSRFGFQGRAGLPVTVTVDALAADTDALLDPVVELLGPDGEVLGRDDDSGAGRNARLRVRLAESGLHVVVVTPFREDQTGPFRIVVTSDRRSGTLGDGPANRPR